VKEQAAEGQDRIVLENQHVALGFSQRQQGALVSVLDKQTGCDLIRDSAARGLLWKLAVRRQSDHQLVWVRSADTTRLECRQEERDGVATLSLTTSGLNLESLNPESAILDPSFSVTVHVSLPADSALSCWRVEVTGLGQDAALHELTCPIVTGLVKLGDPAPGESLAGPIQGEGYVFHNPYPVRDRLPLCSGAGPEQAQVGLGSFTGRYPGSLSLQMYAFYHDRAGLYFAAHDAGQHAKELAMGPWPEAETPVLRMSHFPGEIPGQPVTIPYDAVVGVFHGDWHDAADLYKAWATRQWWCAKRLEERDVAGWLRTGVGGVYQMSNYHIPKITLNHAVDQIAGTVNDLSRAAGVPLIGLVFNWEQGGAWTGPKGFFPPREGREPFRAAMAKLRAAGNHGMVYITGGVWYIRNTYDPLWDSSAVFDTEGVPHAFKGPDGTAEIESWYPGWKSAWLCPHGDYLKELTAALVLDCLDLGVTVVQIDNFPIGGSRPCYDPAHGHPPGDGAWRGRAWNNILAEVRRRAKARNPDCALSTEGIAECYIPWIDLYDQRAGNMEYFGHYYPGQPMGGEVIPLFNYVYHEYVGAYHAAYPECNRPEVLYWTRGLAKALTQGVVPTGGRYFPDPPADNPVTIGFYQKIVRTAKACWPWIMFGEMLRPPAIDVPDITAQYCKFNYVPEKQEHRIDPQQRHEVRDRAVQHGVFRGPDGSIAYVLANASEEPVAFDVELSGHGADAATFDVRQIIDGEPAADRLHNVSLPRREHLEMKPLSVTVFIVTPSAS